MKAQERERARALRRQGWSVRSIAKEISCSKSSISVWVRDIPLTKEQINNLKSSQDRARAKAADHPNSSRNKWQQFRQEIISKSKKDIPNNCSLEMLRHVGAALYWAEGYTASRASFVFANVDPAMIKLMLRFLKEACGVKKNKLRGRVNIHPHLNIKAAEIYWSKQSGIPLKQFHKPLLAVSRASKHKRKTLPYGTFRVVISDVVLCSKIKGWIEGLKNWAVSSVG